MERTGTEVINLLLTELCAKRLHPYALQRGLRCWVKQSQCGHSQCHDAPCLAQHCFFPLKKCVALRLHYILRDLILAEFLGCVNALARLIAGFIGFALISPTGTFSRAREKGLVSRVIGCFLRLPAWPARVERVYC